MPPGDTFFFFNFLGSFLEPFFFFFPPINVSSAEYCSVRNAVLCTVLCIVCSLTVSWLSSAVHIQQNWPFPTIFTPLRRVLWLNSAAARCQCSFTWELVFHWTRPKHIKFFKNLGNLPVVKFSITHHSCSSLDRAVLLRCLAICALRTCSKGKQSLHLFYHGI